MEINHHILDFIINNIYCYYKYTIILRMQAYFMIIYEKNNLPNYVWEPIPVMHHSI